MLQRATSSFGGGGGGGGGGATSPTAAAPSLALWRPALGDALPAKPAWAGPQAERKLTVLDPSASDAPLSVHLHPMLPLLLRVSAHRLTVMSTTVAEHVLFQIPVDDEQVLGGCFFDGDVLEAESLLPPALVCDCNASLVLGVCAKPRR
jgi:hypothetical protein